MTSADSSIVGIVALLVMSIPGVWYLARMIRQKFHSRRKKSSDRNTVLPLSDYALPNLGQPGSDSMYIRTSSATAIGGFGIAHQVMHGEAPQSPIAPNLMQGFVSAKVNSLVERCEC